jgi:hypothetical protein
MSRPPDVASATLTPLLCANESLLSITSMRPQVADAI